MSARPDIAKAVKDALAAGWDAPAPIHATPTLHVDDDFIPRNTDEPPPAVHEVALLVADDGGPRHRWFGDPWMRHLSASRRPLLRLTAFAKGRDDAREAVQDAADWVCDNKGAAGIARVDDVSDPLITRDRATGVYLASVTMPAIVRPS